MKSHRAGLAILPLLAGGCAQLPAVQLVRQDVAQVDRKVDSSRVELRTGLDSVRSRLATIDDSLRNGASTDRLRADLLEAISNLSTDLRQVRNQLEGLDQRLGEVEREMALMRSVRGRGGQVDSARSAALSAVELSFRTASDDFARGRFDLAYRGFQDVLTRDSSGTWSPKAMYQMGECRFAQGNWEESRSLFARVERDWPRDGQVCSALFKLGLSQEKLLQTADRDSSWSRLQSRCPGSNEAMRAKDLLANP